MLAYASLTDAYASLTDDGVFTYCMGTGHSHLEDVKRLIVRKIFL